MTITIVPVRTGLPAGFATLRDEARREGHTHVLRLLAG
jgi:hypothetical protein